MSTHYRIEAMPQGRTTWQFVEDGPNSQPLHDVWSRAVQHLGPDRVRILTNGAVVRTLPPIPMTRVTAILNDGPPIEMTMTDESAARMAHDSKNFVFWDSAQKVIHVFPPNTHHVKYLAIHQRDDKP